VKRVRHRALLLTALLGATAAVAAAPDAALLGRVTGVEPEVAGDVVRVSVPRSDLAVAVDGVGLAPFQGLTS
jgi:hypothetical protein